MTTFTGSDDLQGAQFVDAIQHSIGPSASGDDAVNLSTQSGSVSGVGEIAFCDGVAIVDAARY